MRELAARTAEVQGSLNDAAVSALTLFSKGAEDSKKAGRLADMRLLYNLIISFFGNFVLEELEKSGNDSHNFLESIAEQARDTQSKFDTPTGSSLGADDLICIRQFGSAICIWIKDLAEPIKPEGAPPLPALW